MEYIHIKDLEIYHPKYKDRTLTWGKIHFKLVTNPKYKKLLEVDRFRFIALILLELHLQEPVPNDPDYLKGLGFNLRKRPMSLTLQMLQEYVKVCYSNSEKPVQKSVSQSRVEKSRVEKKREDICVIFSHWNSKKQRSWKSHRELTPEISEAIEERLKKYSPEQLVEAIDNYARVLLSPEFVWSRDWPLRLFLTRSRPDQRGELQLYRFLGTNFSEQDFELTSLGKQRREERKKYSDKIINASEESLLKIYRDKNYTRQWLIDELRPEILEIINKE
jgi:hypothetical protein